MFLLVQAIFGIISVPITAVACIITSIGVLGKSVVNHGKEKQSEHKSKDSIAVTTGLLVMCVIFIFSAIGYHGVFFVAQRTAPVDNTSIAYKDIYFAISSAFTVLNSVMTGPIYMCIPPMRRALFKKLGCRP